MENNINKKAPSNEDEIDLRKLFDAIWDGKWIIVASATILSIIAVLISISLPNVYKSEALLSPVVSEAVPSGAIRDVGGIASLAGINLQTQPAGNSTKALKKLRTLSFYEDNILPNIFLPDLMALKSWDSKNNKIIYDKNIYNHETQAWSRIPSSQKSYKKFKRILGFKKDYETGFITISIRHQSPYIAQEWTNLIVNELNNFFRTNDKREAQAAMDFLNTQMAQTSYTEIKQVIAQLLQNKMQQLTLIEANDFYVFSYLDPPKVMEEKIEPNRRSISILGAVLGILLGILIIIVREFFGIRKIWYE
ncbi:Wzz/FepE/Etk N-terminal domain-containing protein [Gammaproteobacteria bacterium]|nr:Wzz/FepE/Etk N-terminal domain-containing protein [Gammaproteobacteria bacterium]